MNMKLKKKIWKKVILLNKLSFFLTNHLMWNFLTNKNLLWWFVIFICTVVSSSLNNCPSPTFFFQVKPQKCYFSTIEKKLFTKLNIVQTNTHDTVLKHWLENYEKFKNKKLTILHIDSRKD